MMTTEFINENFMKISRYGDRWAFEPKPGGPLVGYRYFLSFFDAERRFVLTRMKITPYETVTDDEMLKAFRGALEAEEVASCIRSAIAQPLDDDNIPF